MASYPWLPAALVLGAKLVIALATSALLVADLPLRARSDRGRRARDGLLLALGVAGGLAWWSFYAFPVHRWVHEHDGFHYFVGARYFDELGYTRLYACALAADLEAGLGPWVAEQPVRNLATNELEPGAAAQAQAARCRARFTPERWAAFAADVAWFRSIVSLDEWVAIRRDHGFNASPVWRIAGGALAEAAGSAARGFVLVARVDDLLLLGMWAGLVAAFGWRTAAVAAVFWGTNGLAGFEWTGGSLLRQDWLVALLLGLACLRARRPALAGALLTFSALVRVFPVVAIAAMRRTPRSPRCARARSRRCARSNASPWGACSRRACSCRSPPGTAAPAPGWASRPTAASSRTRRS